MSSALQREVVEILAATGRSFEVNVRFDWLTNRTPVEPESLLSPRVKYRLVALHRDLGGDRIGMPKKRIHYLRFDVKLDEDLLTEIDTRPHFSSSRLRSLTFYDDLEHHLDLDLYRDLCLQYRDQADGYQRT